MCGIAGYIKLGRQNSDDRAFFGWFNDQLDIIKRRGLDAAGVVWIIEDQNTREWTLVKEFEIGADYNILDHFDGREPIRHARNGALIVGCLINFRNIPVTEFFGGELTSEQIQPFVFDKLAIAHNGLLSNDKRLAKRFNWPRMMEAGEHDIDSYAFLQLYRERPKYEPIADMFNYLEGSWSAALLDAGQKRLHLSRTFLGLDLAAVSASGNLYLAWGSEITRPADMPEVLPPQITFVEVAEFPAYSCTALDLSGTEVIFPLPGRYLLPNMLKSIQPLDKAAAASPTQITPIYKIAVVASGGLDSTVALTMQAQFLTSDYLFRAKYSQEGLPSKPEIHILHFNYGAKAQIPEQLAITAIAEALQRDYPEIHITLQTIDLTFLKHLGGSTLTTDAPITKGEQGIETAKEWVPARNTVMMAMAAAYCDRHKLQAITLGLNREESAVYCDNSSEFFSQLEKAFLLGTQSRPMLLMPLANMMKHHIVAKGIEISAPLHLSWSCYDAQVHPRNITGLSQYAAQAHDPGEPHIRCGECSSCLLRRRAYAMNGLIDPMPYLKSDPVAAQIFNKQTSADDRR